MTEIPWRSISHPLLTAEEEITLCQKAREGCRRSRDAMVENNLRLVAGVAKRFHGRSLTHEDLVQEGVVGLLTAVDRFDPAKGWRFSTYATFWIRQAITRALEKHDRIIRIPSHAHDIARQARRAEDRLQNRTGRSPSQEEIVVEAEMDATAARTYYRLTEDAVSADWVEDSDSSAILDFLVDEQQESALEGVLREEWEEMVRGFIARLSPREQLVIAHRFGFATGFPQPLREISEPLGGMSHEGVRQIEVAAIKKLRRMMKAEGFEFEC